MSQLFVIAREWRRQGRLVGSRPVLAALKGVRVRLIRTVVAELKRRRRARRQRHQLANRTTVTVHNPGTMVAIDAARVPQQEGGEHIVFRDRGSLSVHAKRSEGIAICASDTLKVLRELKQQGRMPLVIASDNGSPFIAGPVEEFLRENKVVHLKSLPRVPQQNGSAENAVGELKRLTREGWDCDQACRILNHSRKRESLHWKTPAEIDQNNFQPYTQQMRDEFYATAKAAIKAARLGTKTAYEKRKAEREAIFQTLESFSLITRIRGHRRA